MYCETGHPVSGPSGYQYPTDWYPIRSGPGTEIDFGVIRPDAPDYLTGPVTTPVEHFVFAFSSCFRRVATSKEIRIEQHVASAPSLRPSA